MSAPAFAVGDQVWVPTDNGTNVRQDPILKINGCYVRLVWGWTSASCIFATEREARIAGCQEAIRQFEREEASCLDQAARVAGQRTRTQALLDALLRGELIAP